MTQPGFAVVTGGSSGIGYELARRTIEDGHTLLICAETSEIEAAADKLRHLGGQVETVQADLTTPDGIEALWAAIGDRPVDLFFANAGRALGRAFHDQDWGDIETLIALNVKQTTAMLHRAGRRMHDRGEGRILVTGSIGGFVPGPFDAVYNGTKAYIDSLCAALCDEWQDGGVTLTCLMPGPTETPIFDRGDLGDTPIGKSDRKDDPVMVARAGYDAMMRGDASVVPGMMNTLIAGLSGVVPDAILNRIHRAGAEPEKKD